MKKILVKIGNVIAVLIMFAPIYIIINPEKFTQIEYWILLISSILYDIYMYFEIIKQNYIRGAEKKYYDFIKPNNKINANITTKSRLENSFKFIEELFENIKDN